jgi:hypothetical protein
LKKTNKVFKMKSKVFPFLFILIALIACNRNSNDRLSTDLVNNPNSADTSVSSDNLPIFKFENDLHDFGKVIEGEKLTYSFKFKNIGKSDLVISAANATCGCTVPDFPREPIRPGVEGMITITFNTKGKMGFQHKTITLVANTQPNNYVLTVKATVNSPENN